MPAAGKQNDHTFMWYYDICIGETHWNVVISCWDYGTWLFFWGLWISHLQSVLVSCLGLKWGERRWGRWSEFFCDACRKKNPRDIKMMMTNAVAYVHVCAPFVALIQPMQSSLHIFQMDFFCTALKLSCLLWFIVVRSLFHTTHY